MAEKFSVTLQDGTIMQGWHWAAENPTVNFTFITGMNEYAFRYDGLAQFFASKGIEVWILDALGQGLNAESVEKQEIWPKDGFAKNVEGIHLMDELAKKNGLPLVQGGHSMGSFLTQARLERYPLDSRKTIIIGTNGGQAGLMKIGYKVAKSKVKEKNWLEPVPALDKMGLGGYTKAVKNRKTDLDWLSYNEENVQKYIADPYCGHQDTGSFWLGFLQGMSTLWSKKEMAKISPKERVYITAGAEDPVGRNGKGPEWLAKAYKKLGMTDVTLKIYPHMRHEIHNETGKEQVWNDLAEAILH